MSKDRDLLVLHVSAEELRVAAARLEGGCVLLSGIAAFASSSKEQDASAILDQTAVDAFAKHISQQSWNGRNLVCVVGGSAAAIHYYDMPPLSGSALEQAVRLKLAPQLHFEASQAVISITEVASTGPNETKPKRIQASAVRRDVAEGLVEAAGRAGLNLLALVAAPAVLGELARERSENPTGTQAVLHIEERGALLVVLDGSRLVLCTEIAVAAADLTAAYMRPIISGDNVLQLDQAAALKLRQEVGIPRPDQDIATLDLPGDRLLPLLEPVLQKMAKQLTQWLTFAATCNKGSVVRRVSLVGPGGAIPGLAAALASKLAVEVEERCWMAGWARVGVAGTSEASVEDFAALAGAAALHARVPDLRPPEYLRARRIGRIRRIVAVSGPIAACAILSFGLLFGRIDSSLSRAVSNRQTQLNGVQQIVGENDKLGLLHQRVQGLEKDLAQFASAAPGWTGVFKELSIMLPAEIRALEYSAQEDAGGMRMLIRAGVHPARTGRGFDEIVSQTLLLLQRSALFKRVELVSANKGAVSDDPGAAGVLSVQLDLVYARLKERA